MSLLGLYKWDNTILDGLTLPSNFESSELNFLKTNLLMETAEFEILYPDPTFLKYAITQWCSMRSSTWEWLKETQQYQYNPLWNENYTDNIERDLAGTLDKTDDLTRALKTKDTGDITDKNSGTDSKLHNVYSYNDNNTGAPESSDNTTYGSQTKRDLNTTKDETGTRNITIDQDTTDTGTIDRTVQGLHGAFAQDAIKKEQDLAMFNVLDYIIQDFKKRFCLLVY